MGITFLSGRLSACAVKALAVVVAVVPAAAQTGAAPSPSTTATPSPGGSSSSELVARFVSNVMPTANFVATASRMAISKSSSSKLQKFAETLAKDQSAITRSLSAWVNVTGPVVTRNPHTAGVSGPAARISAPNFLPFQADNLQRLSASQGKDFDSLFVSTQMEALVQLQTLFRDFIQNGTDPGLLTIATRELPKVEQSISSLDAL